MTAWLAAAATTLGLLIAVPTSAQAGQAAQAGQVAQRVQPAQVVKPARAATVAVGVQDTLAARAIHFQRQNMTTDLQRTLHAMDGLSPADGVMWRNVIALWNEANTSLKINATVPAGLPTSGHVFALLGFALAADGTMQPELVSRLRVAKAALDTYPASRIVVSGGVDKNGWTEAKRMQEWLLANGIASSRIILENEAVNTQTNASKSLAIMYADGGITSYTVISSASHIRRASILYHAASLKAQKETGASTFIRPLSNVAYLDNTTSEQPPSASDTTLIASNVASLFGVSTIYDAYATTPPPRPGLAVSAGVAAPGTRMQVSATFTNGDLFTAEHTIFRLTAPAGYVVHPTAQPDPAVLPGATAVARWEVEIPADQRPMTRVTLSATTTWDDTGGDANTVAATAAGLVAGPVSAPYLTASRAPVQFAQNSTVFAISGGGRDAYVRYDEFGTVYQQDQLATGQAVSTTVLEQSDSGPYARAGLVVRNDLATNSAGYATLAVTPGHGCMFTWDSDGDGTLDRNAESGGFTAPVQARISRAGQTLTGSCSGDGVNWVDVASTEIASADAVVDAGLMFSAVNASTGLSGFALFDGLRVVGFSPRGTSGDAVVSVGKPATALSSETGRSPAFAVDGDRTNNRYWASSLAAGPTSMQVDLGAQYQLSSINVRNYVLAPRSYQYNLSGSRDGENWFPLGGKSWSAAATDPGDTFPLDAVGRYVRVTGLANTANPSFHVTEMTVRGAVAPEVLLPNLTIGQVIGTQTAAGAPVTLSATVVNSGRTVASGVVVEFRDGSTVLATSQPVDITAGGSAVVTSPWSAGERRGTVQVTAVADPAGTISESNTADNTATGTVLVARPAPTVTTVTVPAATGSAGNVSTKGTLKVTVAVTAADVIPSGDVSILLGDTVIGTGTLSDGTAVVTLRGLPAGVRQLVAHFPGDAALASSDSAAKSVTVYFSDYKSGQFFDDIMWLAQSGITTGNPDGGFQPNGVVSRQAMAAFLYRLSNPGQPDPACTTSAFTDVPTTNPFCGAIAWLASEGISTGYSNGTAGKTFKPGAAVTRDAMAAFLYRLAHDGADAPACTVKPFTDVPLNQPFCGAISWLKTTGISTGNNDGTFTPGDPVSRQAMAAFLHRYAAQ